MPINKNIDIRELGFKADMFKYDNDPDFNKLIDAVLAEQTKILEGRLGSTIYGSTTSPEQDYVKRAEKALVAAEMVERRINIILGNTVGVGAEISTKYEENQQKKYSDQAEQLILRLISGTSADSDDFATGVLETSHFESPATLGGLEV